MKWLIYPYSPKFVPIIKYGKLCGNDSISAIVAPMGFALNGKNAFIWEDGSALSIKSEADVTEEYDGIWITPEIKYMSDIEIVEGLSKLEVCDKTIYYAAIFNNVKEKWLLNFLRKKDVKDIIHRKSLMFDFVWQISDQNMYKINTPIIMVAGNGENSQKFEIQLYLRRKLVELGYKTSQIGTRTYCEMLNFHSIPDWMFDNTLTDNEKVIVFNHFLKTIEISEKPEVIIIGVPEGVMPFNEKHSQGFGLKAYEICSSIHPDYFVMSLYNGQYTKEFLEEMKCVMKYRLNIETDVFAISQFVPVSTSYKKEQLMFAYSDKSIECEKDQILIKDLDDDVLIKRIIDKLSVYDKFEVI